MVLAAFLIPSGTSLYLLFDSLLIITVRRDVIMNSKGIVIIPDRFGKYPLYLWLGN